MEFDGDLILSIGGSVYFGFRFGGAIEFNFSKFLRQLIWKVSRVMKYLKIFFIYCLINMAIRVFAEILKGTWFEKSAGYLVTITVIAMLFHMGKPIKNELLKKKYRIYICIVVSEMIAFQVLSVILNILNPPRFLQVYESIFEFPVLRECCVVS
jgi:hypothetical protein